MTTKADVLAAREAYERVAEAYLRERGWVRTDQGDMLLMWFVHPDKPEVSEHDRALLWDGYNREPSHAGGGR